MKNLKNTAIAFLLTIGTTFIATAQEKTSKENRKTEMKQKLEEAREKLNLTADQELKFKEINKNFAEKLKEIKQSEGEKRDKFKKAKIVKNEKNEAIKDILTDDQFKIYLEMQDDRKADLKAKRAEKN